MRHSIRIVSLNLGSDLIWSVYMFDNKVSKSGSEVLNPKFDFIFLEFKDSSEHSIWYSIVEFLYSRTINLRQHRQHGKLQFVTSIVSFINS